ncbi:MAG: hypothetical protein ABIY55_16670 [Kofleriaceae bacterium]
MVPVCEHPPAPPANLVGSERRIDVPRDRNLEALHPTRERQLVLRLDEHVDVRCLDTEVNDPDPPADRRDDRSLADSSVHLRSAQVANLRHHPQHDVQRVPRLQLQPPLVRRPGS